MKKLRIYLATSFREQENYLKLVEKLELAGFEITHNWVKVQYPREIQNAITDMAGVQAADVVILRLPARLGGHAEMGMALAWGKQVLLLASNEELSRHECVFYPLCIPVRDEEELFACLKRRGE